ncbi:type IV secretory system conjugative DNA transfer family protein [Methylobacterium sp. BTF04]|uniref:type IV secretory system conjugative DNA transfer family protein n=1 Tax=Methylobacterium sp. BTF04 TaxID=2708300 RepID=UPI0013D8BB21|nr:type IV secretory system conjugative DNA transfer family protein [Methylobacterium sp. BTF04]NEU14746.1 type IV secretory system conjugative DNA transfer family protein [Methylobacterium sp. BTF04]
MIPLFWRGVIVAVLAVVSLAVWYPAAFIVQHGFDASAWDDNLRLPEEWFRDLSRWQILPCLGVYLAMIEGKQLAFADGGTTAIVTLAVAVIGGGAYFILGAPTPGLRDARSVLGRARFANAAERATMKIGLELGLDPTSGKPVRVQVEGNLVSIAPPRTGKTSGLIINNLAMPPDAGVWDGPAVIVDPKGEIYRAVAARRRKLGRVVRCIDPFGIVAGRDRWNPLATLNPDDTLYLQHLARQLLPGSATASESSQFFRNRASTLFLGAALAAIRSGQRTPLAAAGFLKDLPALKAALGDSDDLASRAVRAFIDSEAKSKEDVASTAEQAFDWLLDARMQHLTQDPTFELRELLSGDTDLFIVVPSEATEIIAGFLRWLLADLFAAARRHPDPKRRRILCLVDEAAQLGRFDAIVKAAGELPGHGVSLWTFWQSRQQMLDVYGEAGAGTLMDTAEIVTVSDLPAISVDERERFSRILGRYTARLPSTSQAKGEKDRSSTSEALQGVSLEDETGEDILAADSLVVFANSRRYTRHPIRLRKTRSFDDARFAGLLKGIAPVGRS